MKSIKAIKKYKKDCELALAGCDEDGNFVGKLEPDDELTYEGIIEGLDFVLNNEGDPDDQISLNIDVTTNDCDELKSGEEFEWNFDGIDVRLFNPDQSKDTVGGRDSEHDPVTDDEQSKLNTISWYYQRANYPSTSNGAFSTAEVDDFGYDYDEEDNATEILYVHIRWGQQDDCHDYSEGHDYEVDRAKLNAWDGKGDFEHIIKGQE